MTLTAIITARDLDSLAAMEGAVDATLYEHDEAVGDATLAVDHSGHLQIYGDTVDTWADGDLQVWLEAQPHRGDAIHEIVGAVRQAAE